MMHEALALLHPKTIKHLLLTWGTKCDYAQHLRLSTSEDGRPMSARQQSNLTGDGTDRLEVASIRAYAVIQNIVPHIGFKFFFVERDDILELIRILGA